MARFKTKLTDGEVVELQLTYHCLTDSKPRKPKQVKSDDGMRWIKVKRQPRKVDYQVCMIVLRIGKDSYSGESWQVFRYGDRAKAKRHASNNLLEKLRLFTTLSKDDRRIVFHTLNREMFLPNQNRIKKVRQSVRSFIKDVKRSIKEMKLSDQEAVCYLRDASDVVAAQADSLWKCSKIIAGEEATSARPTVTETVQEQVAEVIDG